MSSLQHARQLQHRRQKYNGGMEQRKTILFLATIEQQLLFRKKISIFSDNHILVSLCLDRNHMKVINGNGGEANKSTKEIDKCMQLYLCLSTMKHLRFQEGRK